MTSTLLPVPGVTLGHWTDNTARTGCSVFLFDEALLAAAEVRGGAPGTREIEALGTGRIGRRADAILLTGGSAFGLAAADGVMRFLHERGRGFPTTAGRVPIVPAAVIYDLAAGAPTAPDASAGYHACLTAVPLTGADWGQVGAGTGARFGMVGGDDAVHNGGIGVGQQYTPDGVVTAIVLLNAFGDVLRRDVDAGITVRQRYITEGARRSSFPSANEQSTLIVVIVDAPSNHRMLHNLCVAAHDGLARRVVPVHTEVDGDIVFAVARREPPADEPSLATRLRLAIATELAVERAVLAAASAA